MPHASRHQEIAYCFLLANIWIRIRNLQYSLSVIPPSKHRHEGFCFISSAAGAVGQLVGQVAKHAGLTGIGSVGDDDKLRYITEELGFDAGFDYKREEPLGALRRLAPRGVDIYYENVGGEHLDAALDVMNVHGRIVACGMISQYNLLPEERYGVKSLFHIVTKRIRMQGFVVGDPNMGPKYLQERNERVSRWLANGTIKAQEHITVGIENGLWGPDLVQACVGY
ncbi:hypothetical protein BDV12DRAFT_198913 [Aspergillus spectabilis]